MSLSDMVDPEWAKFLTDPPCKCGHDLGLEGGEQPRYVEGSTGLAQPRGAIQAAVEVPPYADVTVIMSDLTGRATGRFSLTPGGYHIMTSPVGQQYSCSATLVATTKEKVTDDTVYLYTDPLKEYGEEGAPDMRVMALRHFWARQGVPDITVWGLKRVKPAKVRGQIALVRLNTRWFTPNGVFRDLGTCCVVEEPDGVLRFLDPEAMNLEFRELTTADGTRICGL
ncbi:MAG TPA: hypothetical protein VLA88_05550 [Candidatus Saccharimonadales bacterium]|nr:hypothetical protein [Candidatus Saccharimonadales bacterium]